MRKASFIIISTLIIVFLTGNYFIYKQITKAHKKEFKAYIRSRFAKTIKISIHPSELYSNNSKINWLDDNKEVIINDVLYDVISIKNNGTLVVLTVVDDKKEKELMDTYRDRFDDFRASHSSKNKPQVAKDFFSLKYLPIKTNSFLLHLDKIHFSLNENFRVTKGHTLLLTPPPDLI